MRIKMCGSTCVQIVDRATVSLIITGIIEKFCLNIKL